MSTLTLIAVAVVNAAFWFLIGVSVGRQRERDGSWFKTPQRPRRYDKAKGE